MWEGWVRGIPRFPFADAQGQDGAPRVRGLPPFPFADAQGQDGAPDIEGVFRGPLPEDAVDGLDSWRKIGLAEGLPQVDLDGARERGQRDVVGLVFEGVF